ncbi:hypothetical protein VQ7734_01152 [Vibrio quintilis]|uniref:Uncharacterized protein n=2 Tax=Vibrio quintilis TaxID=1117707 RepID=A0A1M7YS11_9VIBR|nr:hypothetical protein VQ7734_01152 [Vibrio quintilis]
MGIPVFIAPAVDITSYIHDVNHIPKLEEQIHSLWTNDYNFKVSKYSDKNSSKPEVVNNCKSMLNLYPMGFRPTYIPDTDIYNYLYAKCKSIDISLNIYPSSNSYVANFKLNTEGVKNLPKNIAFIPSTSEYKDIHSNEKIKILEEVNHIIKVTQKSNLRVIAEDNSGGIQDISILAKGDYNHDNIEDIMFKVSNSVIGGSYTSYYLYILTKTEKDGDWIVLDEYPKHS